MKPANIPRTDYDWNYFEEYKLFQEFLIKNPATKKMKDFNHILAPKGNPFNHITDAMLPYMKNLPKNHLEKQMYAKFHEDISRGIELRLLTDDEFIQRLEDKVKKGYQFSFLMNKPEDVSIKDWIAKIEKISYK